MTVLTELRSLDSFPTQHREALRAVEASLGLVELTEAPCWSGSAGGAVGEVGEFFAERLEPDRIGRGEPVVT